MTIKQIKKLRPEFKFGGTTMIDWFEVHSGHGYCTIKSGLRHADDSIKSPYFYEHGLGGINAESECIKYFTEWWNSINK